MKLVRYFLTIVFTVLFFSANAQIIQVIDQNTKAPIEDVAVFNLEKTESVVTNAEGKSDLSIFSKEAYITFQHPAYQETTLQKGSITGGTIALSERVIKMKDVVISANKWEQDISEIPNEIISISSKDIAFTNPQTSADMLSSTGEVFVQKSQAGGGSPKLRGFAANSVLMVVDGVRMNNAIYRSGNLQNIINVDPNSLAGAEVILGPGSVIYGSDALGGVMDFHTKDPKFAFDDQTRVAGGAFTRYSSANNEKTLHADLNLGRKNIALYSSFSFSDFGDTRAGSDRPDGYPDFGKKKFYVAQDLPGNDIVVKNEDPNVQRPSGFELWSTIHKLSYRPVPEVKFTYGFYLSSTSNIPRYDRLVETDENGIPFDAEWHYGPQKWMMNSLTTTFVSPTKLFDQAKIIAAYQDYEESRIDRGFGSDHRRTRKEEVDLWSVNVDFDKQLNKGNLYYGAEVLYNDVASSAKRVNLTTDEITYPSTRYPAGGSKYWSYAGYLSHKWNLSPRWILNSGARYSLIKLEAKVGDQNALDFPFNELNVENGALNGSLGLVFKPKEEFKTNLSLSSGFRAPNVDDIGKVFDFSDGQIQVPNANLEPENSYNAEWGLETRLTKNLEVGATLFYTWVDNAMVRRDFTFNGQDSIIFDGTLSKVVALVNTGEAYIYGFNLEMEARLSDSWATQASVTGTYGKDKTNDEPLRHTTPLFGKASIIYQHNKLRAQFSVDFNGPRFRKDIPSSEIDDKPFLYAKHQSDPSLDGTPGWYTLNLKGAYQVHRNFKVSGGIDNILDKHYRPYSSGISAPGINFYLALQANF